MLTSPIGKFLCVFIFAEYRYRGIILCKRGEPILAMKRILIFEIIVRQVMRSGFSHQADDFYSK
ncbi:hypothetical protein C9J48_15065 [Photobacterium profundum]|nr:hypothetical protein C9J48_15065 [Photobacterium profundum]